MPQETHPPKVYRVSELTLEIQRILEKQFEFVWVEGEISNFSRPGSGHLYMVIKDEKSQIRAVMFRLQARYLKFVPENGMHVLAQGRLGVYPARGEYQIILDYLEPMGVGALALAFEQLKKKLASRGVFDPEIKRPIPFLPQRVAVITSPTGAAVRDFLKIIQRRFANIEIIVVPVRVQGDEACGDMVKAIELVNRELNVDVIVITRGGGSLEDLWAFNQEALALAIRKSAIPVVSAVGHEIDVTICDLASDFRAPTPSAAAELLVKEKEELAERLGELKDRLLFAINRGLEGRYLDLDDLANRLRDPGKRLLEFRARLREFRDRLIWIMGVLIQERNRLIRARADALTAYSPRNWISNMSGRITFLGAALVRAMSAHLKDAGAGFSTLEKRLKDLSPLSILKRGYSITRKIPEKTVLRDTAGVEQADLVQVLLARGELTCRVEAVGSRRSEVGGRKSDR